MYQVNSQNTDSRNLNTTLGFKVGKNEIPHKKNKLGMPRLTNRRANIKAFY